MLKQYLLLAIFITVIVIFFIKLNKKVVFSTFSFPIGSKLIVLRDNWQNIANECDNLKEIDWSIKRKNNEWTTEEGKRLMESQLNDLDKWTVAWSPDNKWLNYPLLFNNKLTDSAKRIFPLTCKYLTEIGLDNINVAGFSKMLPGSYIAPHQDNLTGLYNGRLAYHLGLNVPDKCYLVINDRIMVKEKNGKDFLFDATNIHYAYNESDKERTVLYMDLTVDKSKHNITN